MNIIVLASQLVAFADPIRLRILGLLSAGEMCAGDLQRALRIPQPSTSRQLAALRLAKAVETRRAGLRIYYRLARPAEPAFADLLRLVSEAAAAAGRGVDSGNSPAKSAGPMPPHRPGIEPDFLD